MKDWMDMTISPLRSESFVTPIRRTANGYTRMKLKHRRAFPPSWEQVRYALGRVMLQDKIRSSGLTVCSSLSELMWEYLKKDLERELWRSPRCQA